jgi:hypothetical protein
VVLYLRSWHDQVAGDLLKRLALHQRHCQGSTHRSDGQRDSATEALNESRASPSRCDIFPIGSRRIGSAGAPSIGARRGLRLEGGGTGR